MFVAATGVALLAMVARISKAEQIAVQADALRAEFLNFRLADEGAYQEVIAAQKLPRDDPYRPERLQKALEIAAKVPLFAAVRIADSLEVAEATLTVGSTALVSDVGCALRFLQAAFQAALYNVRINVRYMKDPHRKAQFTSQITELRTRFEPFYEKLLAGVEEKLQ